MVDGWRVTEEDGHIVKRTIKFHPRKSEARAPRVILYGLGAIGMATARCLLSTRQCEIVGVVDADPAKAGRPLSQALGAADGKGLRIARDLAALGPIDPPADAAIHMAGSRLKHVAGQLLELAEAGLNVVSSSEELFYPFLQNPEIARELDRKAREKGVTIVGTGVNPGFVMDVLPVVMTCVCTDVKAVHATRVVDAATRRGPLQKKIGAGLTPEEFESLARQGKLGHVGLVESVAFIADALGLAIEEIEEELSPAIADRPIHTEHASVEPGQVTGIRHRARGTARGKILVALDLDMYLGAQSPRDEIRLEANPRLHVVIPGGTAGDHATVAALVNAVDRAMAAPPGLCHWGRPAAR